jgi:hypothetical protein
MYHDSVGPLATIDTPSPETVRSQNFRGSQTVVALHLIRNLNFFETKFWSRRSKA